MATVIQNTIGAGGDYSTIQSWEDAAPADLVAADQVWEGLCLNQNFQTSITIGGSTTNASCYKHLTAQVGESFADLVGEPLRLIQGNGAEISRPEGYSTVITVSEANARIDRLQIYATQSTTFGVNAANANPFVISDCIIYTTGRRTLQLYGASSFGYNLLLLVQGGTLDIVEAGGSSWIESSTLIRGGSTPSGPGIVGQYGASTVKNVAIFNCATTSSGNNVRTFVNCFTDVATPPAGFTTVPYDTTTGSGFVNITAGSYDFKLNPSSAMVDAGVDTAYPTDIYGTPRPSGQVDVGCYEISGAAPGVDHATDGDVEGNTADVTGDSLVTQPAPVHASTGAVVGNTANVVGTAKRFLLHTTSGDVVDSTDATVTGQAELINAVYLHETDGVLTGQLGTVVGTARRFRTHTSSGVLFVTDGNGDVSSIVVGQSEIVSPPGEHETYGVLTGQHGTVVGTAKHLRKHVTSGNVVDSTDATVTGEVVKFAEHDTSGIIVGYDSKVIGSATNVGSLTLTPADIAAIVAALKVEILPVNIVRVNYVEVDGTGADSDPWGPV